MNMKKTNLRLVLESLENEAPIIRVPEEIRLKARKALDRMVESNKMKASELPMASSK